jgi:hypothetical protein
MTIYEDIAAVVERMKPIDITYGQPMVDYMTSINSAYTSEMPFYMYGHRAEINKRLQDLKNGKITTFKRYPLIALKLDVEESIENGIASYNLNIGIFSFTKENYNAEERVERIFKPILHPLYNRFIEELRASGLFIWSGHYVPSHTKIDRPFYGTQDNEGSIKKIFSDPLDCVELIDLKLKKKIC